MEGKVDYAALYETLSRVLAEDRRLRKDLDVPAKLGSLPSGGQGAEV